MSTTQTSVSTRQLIFTISHICDEIARHLSAKDIRRCTFVSREFHQLFFPYTWNSISISRRSLYNSLRDKIRSSEGQALTKNQHRIHRLSSIYGETWDLFLQKIDPPLETTLAATTLHTPSNVPAPIPQYSLRAPFSNLTALHALSTAKRIGVHYKNHDHIHQLLAIVQQSPRLRELEMIQFCRDDSMQIARLAHIVRDHRSLRELKIKMVSIVCPLYRKLLWASWNLDRLEITSCVEMVFNPNAPEVCLSEDDEREFDTWIARNRPEVYAAAKEAAASNDTDKGRVLFRLKEFYLFYGQFDHEIGATFPFLHRCRALERLRLSRIYSRRAMAEFAEQIPDNWPNLEHLDMGTLDPGRQVGDEFEARVLARCATAKSRYGGLKSLVVAPSHIAIPTSMRMIHDHHSATLVHLSLVGCYRVEGHHLQGLLSSCPHLKSFVALCEYRIRPPPRDVDHGTCPGRPDPCGARRGVCQQLGLSRFGVFEAQAAQRRHVDGRGPVESCGSSADDHMADQAFDKAAGSSAISGGPQLGGLWLSKGRGKSDCTLDECGQDVGDTERGRCAPGVSGSGRA